MTLASVEELLTKCANCLKIFETDSERVTSLRLTNRREPLQNEDHVHDHDHPEFVQSHGSGLSENLAIVQLSKDNLVEQEQDPELEHQESLSVTVTFDESQFMEATGGSIQLHPVTEEETQRLIEEGVNIIVEKKPFISSSIVEETPEPMEHMQNSNEQVNPGDGESLIHEQEGELQDEDTTSVSILEAVSYIFKIPLEIPSDSENFEEKQKLGWRKDDPCALCIKCADIVGTLYAAFHEFNEISDKLSYISKGISNRNLHLVREVVPEPETVIPDYKTAAVDTGVIFTERKKVVRKKRLPRAKQPIPKKVSGGEEMEEADVDKTTFVDEISESEEEIFGGVNENHSSDSNSLSDLEEAIQSQEESSEPRITRVSTRNRTAKKQPSDYEELESSEEEPEPLFEDDEEEDPNFNNEEELEDIKVKQENLRIRQISDIIAQKLEIKEELLEMEDGKYKCPDPECSKLFKGLRTLNKHAVIHNLSKGPKCPKCSKDFESLEELQRHLKTHHAVSTVKRVGRPPGRKKVGRPKKLEPMKKKFKTKKIKKECPTCGKEFASAKSLERHAADHIENGPVKCEECGKDFSTPYYLKRHKRDVHEVTELDYSCPECGELIVALATLKEHYESSHNAKLNFCTVCGKTFTKGRYLRIHLVDTHKVDPEEESFKQELSSGGEDINAVIVKEEMEIDDPLLETGERKRKSDPTPHKCPHCDKEYKRKKQLEIHILFHNGEEPQHGCKVCTKRFFQPRSLKRHMLLHTTDNPHVCSECERVFPRADHLKRHIEASHSSNRHKRLRKLKRAEKDSKDTSEHKCHECDKIFTRKEYLRLHQRIHTGEKPFVCSDCGKTFRDPRNLAQHLVTHKTDRPFCCSICGLTFKRAHHLNDHEGTHREDVARPFVCTLPNCGKAFKLRKHLISHELVHSGTKDHQCEICGKAFNRKDNLRQHVNKVHGKDSFSDLIRVPADCQLVTQSQLPQQIQIEVQGPDGTVTTMQTTTTMTLPIPPHTFSTTNIPTAHFTYTHL